MAKTCDTPLCGAHRVRVGPNRDLCPACAATAASAGSVAIATAPDDELAISTPDDAQPTLFDLAVPANVTRIQ